MRTRRNVYLAVYEGFADWEIGYACAAINDPQFHRDPSGTTIVTVGDGDAPVRSMGGLTVQPDLTIDEVDAASAAMLILPGSSGWDFGSGIRRDRWIGLVRRLRDQGTPVAAICGAVFGLAAAGLLDDHAHTGAAPEYLAASGYAAGDRYVDADAVSDGGWITAGPTHPVAFAREVLDALDLFAPETLEAWSALFSTGRPEHHFALMASVER